MIQDYSIDRELAFVFGLDSEEANYKYPVLYALPTKIETKKIS